MECVVPRSRGLNYRFARSRHRVQRTRLSKYGLAVSSKLDPLFAFTNDILIRSLFVRDESAPVSVINNNFAFILLGENPCRA